MSFGKGSGWAEEAVPDAAVQKERYESFPAHEFSVLKQMIWADYAQNHKYSKEFNFHGWVLLGFSEIGFFCTSLCQNSHPSCLQALLDFR